MNLTHIWDLDVHIWIIITGRKIYVKSSYVKLLACSC